MVDFSYVPCKPGLTIWRLEQMKVVLVNENEYGKFFEGDSYIVLFGSKPDEADMKWWIHFWLGSKTSQDEAGAAAFKSVELDEKLGGNAVQNREVQGHECRRFLGYFREGITYKCGGTDSIWKNIDSTAMKIRLLRLKGRHRIRMTEMPLTWDSLNSGDVFILQNGLTTIVWNGKTSNRREKIHAINAAKSLQRDMHLDGRILIADEDDENKEINGILKMALGHEKHVNDSCPESDEQFERTQQILKIYRISDSSGTMLATELTCSLSQSCLSSGDCYVIDKGAGGIYVWKGKEANKNEKCMAMKYGISFIQMKKYPTETHIMVVKEGSEPTQFKMLFPEWLTQMQVETEHFRDAHVQPKFDGSILHNKSLGRTRSFMPDNCKGKIDIWVLENSKLIPVEENRHGHFFAGSCYLVNYTYKRSNKDNFLLYYWNGLDSTKNEQMTIASLANKFDNSLGGVATQIRLTQGKESEHFLSIFQGNLIIHLGKNHNNFPNFSNLDKSYLYRVRGKNKALTKTVEVNATAAQLNSNDSFVLNSDPALYVWHGLFCSCNEKEMAKDIAPKISAREPITILEEQEPAEFWSYLGGKAKYFSGRSAELTDYEPRLFHLSNSSGRFTSEEICNFTQSDLYEDDVMLLDGFYEIFIWIGAKANDAEKSNAKEIAIQYLEADPSGRDASTTIYEVKQGYEPINFTGLFPDWGKDRFCET